MKNLLSGLIALIIFSGCAKEQLKNGNSPDGFTEYTIAAGSHNCNKSSIKKVSLTSQNFTVIFDSSAVYKTLKPENQADINKLFGFTEGIDPHTNSARIGWAYYDSKLRLYGYVYNDKVRMSQEIAAVKIGDAVKCAITIVGGQYHFTVDEHFIKLPRMHSSASAEGYQLYPYFGGDETAPHQISIRIKIDD